MIQQIIRRAEPAEVSSGPTRRVVLVAGSARTLVGPRAGLIQMLVTSGAQVLCLAPEFSAEQEAGLALLGAELATFALVPRGPRLFADWKISRTLAEVLRNWKPDTVIGIGERVMALALLVAARARVPGRVALVNGLRPRGMPFDALDDPLRATPRLVTRGLKVAQTIVLHNRDDRRNLQRAGALPIGADVRVVPGAGVDLAAFAPAPLPGFGDGLKFLMLGALDRTRGVVEYCEAASRLASRAPRAKFLLAGPSGDGVTGLRPDMLRPYGDAITYLGVLTDVRPALADCHVLVYPAHAEGMPRIVQEALAMGRPVITTTTPGCRDTVDDCVSGMLVPPGDITALEGAMESILKRPDQLVAMSRAARIKAERNFDERDVLRVWADVLGIGARVAR